MIHGTELFYLETYEDSDQIVKPHLSPRGRRVTGPYSTYGAAMDAGLAAQCSHFTISKSYLGRATDVPVIDKPAGQ